MPLSRWTAVFALACLIAGCQSRSKDAGVPGATISTQAASQRASIMQNPDARVGTVLSVVENVHLVAVGDVPVADFRENQTVVFINGAGERIAKGSVARITNDRLHIEYELLDGGRAPQPGDLAVRIFNPGELSR